MVGVFEQFFDCKRVWYSIHTPRTLQQCIVMYSGLYSRWNFIALQKVNTTVKHSQKYSFTRTRPTCTVSEH
jgi:hypothetical protein